MEVCRVCGGELWTLYRPEATPDEDWEEKVGEKVGIDPASSIPHPPDGRCQVYNHQGRMWFKHDDLIHIGYKFLEDGSIVWVNGQFYELLLYWPVEKCWLIKELPTEGVFADAAPEDITGRTE
jgi:hypothetical protein